MVSIFAIGPDDWQMWRSLRLAALAESPDAFSSTLADWSGPLDRGGRWRAAFSERGANFIAELDGVPVGQIRVVPADQEREVELFSLWVATDARGRGVGAALIEAAAEWSSDLAGYHLRLNVKRTNEAAKSLYRRVGFELLGPDPEDPDEDIMVRAQRPQTSGEGMTGIEPA